MSARTGLDNSLNTVDFVRLGVLRQGIREERPSKNQVGTPGEDWR